MARKACLVMLLLLLLLIGTWLASAQKEHTRTPSGPAKAPALDTVSDEDVRAMKSDVQRMRALIAQMQNNLAFVTGTTNPLKHQFELEIEMWQLSLGDLERRVSRAEATQHQ